MKGKKTLLILLRHGQSMWNKKNLFTGWVDVPLSLQGVEEALAAGRKIRHLPIDLIFTSTLIRAQQTAMLVMAEHSSGKVPIFPSVEAKHPGWETIHSDAAKNDSIPLLTAWQLNERMYGQLQGLNKEETAQKFGAEQVKLWRRSYDTAPPDGESLAMTAGRTLPYFHDMVLPHLQQGKNILISAHGNSLRALIMMLDGLTKEQVVSLELATGVPLVYEFFEGAFSKWDGHAPIAML